jgi:enoyl-CoA hydratase
MTDHVEETAAAEPPVRREVAAPHVARLVLNRPDKLNAMDTATRLALARHVDDCGTDDDVRVIVLEGAGRSFSVGADASGRADDNHPRSSWDDRLSMSDTGWATFLRLWDVPKPVIVKVHGHCLGIATILCNLADIVVAAEDARIGWPKLPMGGGVISPTWVWHVGMHRAKEYSYRIGTELSGAEAAAVGFANRAVPAADLEAVVMEMATSIALVPADLLRLKKEALNHVYNARGFREAVLAGSLWGTLSHDMPGSVEVKALIDELGLKGAIEHYRRRGG